MAAQAWAMHVQQEDPESVVREYSYRVEAGSVKKPNIATKIENLNQAMQTLMPIAQGMLQAGQPDLFNSLMTDWGDAMNFDVSKYMIPPPPPPGPPPSEPNSPTPPQGQ
jgi:hypothetical protein